jgi:CheY-like chemotaxis protein
MAVTLHSAPDVGTRFDLLVTVCNAPEGAVDATLQTSGESALGPTPQPNARVLAIDDEVDILDSLASMLPHFGCEVRCATNLIAAVEILDAGFEPEILLVDHRLKGASGPEVIQVLRQRLGDVPAVIVTGDTSPHDMQSAVSAGLRVIHKPLDGRVLARALADSLINPVS